MMHNEDKTCTYCRKPIILPNRRTVDHFIPTCKGGSNLAYNKIYNVCEKCNMAKGGTMPSEFVKKMQRHLAKEENLNYKGIGKDMMPTIIESVLEYIEIETDFINKKTVPIPVVVITPEIKQLNKKVDEVKQIKKLLVTFEHTPWEKQHLTTIRHSEFEEKYNKEPQCNFHCE